MTDIHVIQPSDLGSEFTFDPDTKKWKLTNPDAGVHISSDANNALLEGSDEGVFLDLNSFKKYNLIQDNANSKYKLYEFTGNIFNISTANLVSEVDMGVLHAQLDDISISNDNKVITFIDRQTNKNVVFDLDSPIFSILISNTNAISLSGNGKNSALNATLIVDPDTNNLLKVGINGAIVDKQDILAILNTNPSSFITHSLSVANNVLTSNINGIESQVEIIQQLSLRVNQNDDGLLKLNINNIQTKLGINKLKNTAGDELGFLVTYAPPEA